MESRTRNAKRNIIFGFFLKIYQIIVPFFMRTALIYWMGVNYLGLSSLFTSVLSVLSLTELGVGSAMVYCMYKPIAESDEIKICALLKLYKTYYRIIGVVIAVIGLCITPFIPNLIKDEIPDGINVYILYLINLAATVLSYWLFAYKMSLLQAHQRADVTSKVTIITNTVQYSLQLLVLWVFRDYYLYVIVVLFTQTINNIIIAHVTNKMYPNYQPIGVIEKEEKKSINNRIRDLFTAKFGSVVVGSVDTIVISSFLGLTQLAVYQNYYFVMNSIYGITLVLFTAVIAGIGNSIVTENMEKNYTDLKKFTFITCWMITVCVCCFAVMYQPFMRLWVGESLLLDYSFVILFCILFYVLVLAMVWATIKDAAGLWHNDRFRPLIGAAFNLVLNLILVQSIGLYGIILSTVLSYVFVSMPWLVHNVFKYLYKRSVKDYLLRIIYYIVVCTLSCVITVLICNCIKLSDVLSLCIYFLIAVSVSCLIQYIAYKRLMEYRLSKDLLIKMLKDRGNT